MGNSITSVLNRDKLPKLDGFRAISALIVIVYHFGFHQVPAGFGVMTFFVISGFLITWLLLKENERSGDVSLLDFYKRRSLRIFPAFYCYWLVTVVLLSIRHSQIPWPQALSAAFYVSNYYQGLHGYPNTLFSHTWSLGVEEQFYLLWPAVFLLLRKSPKRLMFGLGSVILALWTYRAFAHLYGAPEPYIYTSFETRSDQIFVGCLTAVILFNTHRARFWNWLYERPLLIVLNIFALAVSIGCGNYLGVAYRNLIGYAWEPLLVAMLLVQILPRNDRVFAWMDSRPVSLLGRISYSTYLYHQIVLSAVLHYVSNPALGLVLGVVVTWGCAAVSYQLVELPFLRLRTRKISPAQNVVIAEA